MQPLGPADELNYSEAESPTAFVEGLPTSPILRPVVFTWRLSGRLQVPLLRFFY